MWRSKKRYENNKERRKEYMKKRRQDHKEYLHEYNVKHWKEYYELHKEQCNKSSKEYIKTHREQRINTQKKYRNSHREQLTEANRERRTSKWYSKAHSITKYYIDKLNIRPDVCPICWTHTIIVAHHPDYSKELEIVFCCNACHKNIHVWNIECPKPINLLDLIPPFDSNNPSEERRF